MKRPGLRLYACHYLPLSRRGMEFPASGSDMGEAVYFA